MGSKASKSKTNDVQHDNIQEGDILRTELKELVKADDKLRLNLTNHIQDIANDLDAKNRHLNIVDTTFGIAGIVGSLLVVIGFGLSFCTAGISLVVTAAGAVIIAKSGLAAISSQIARIVITSKTWAKIRTKVHEYEIQKETLRIATCKVNSFGSATDGTTGNTVAAMKVSKTLAEFTSEETVLTEGGVIVGRVSTKTVKVVFISVGAAVQILHFIGFGVSVIGIGLELYIIVDRVNKLYSKQPSTAAEDMRRLAYRLRGSHRHRPSVSERRLIDRDFRCA